MKLAVRLGLIALAVTGVPSVARAQSGGAATLATDITAEEIAAVSKAMKGADEELRIVDLGRYNLGVAILRRGALKPGGPITALNHEHVTEVYYIVSGAGTLVTGGEVSGVKPLPADNPLVTTVVGPTNTAVLKSPAQTRLVKQGDVVIIPAGVYDGWSEVADHVQYLSSDRSPIGCCRPATSIRS